jgi:hypothetical protein
MEQRSLEDDRALEELRGIRRAGVLIDVAESRIDGIRRCTSDTPPAAVNLLILRDVTTLRVQEVPFACGSGLPPTLSQAEDRLLEAEGVLDELESR